ncbi:hypothetical protein FKW77_000622 [Venturia effusa]|uniref:AB hydrolase-1 domain-containing protein n=1 Tax=Venturia effusa TaxID=50376 RepID=A0A517LPD3_9PEZI|nr:hypothetical protein FKW77_000622 [Venturia effusa]
MASDALPVVVILHEAWHTPTHYGRLIDLLTAQGFATVCPQLLTAHTEENCTSSFNDDCSMIYQLVFDLASDAHDIIVLAHGYGSFVASECLSELSKQVRNNMGRQGGVTELINLCGFLPEHGQSLQDCYGGTWPDFVKEQDEILVLYEPDAVLYNDVGAMERDHWASHLVRFTAKAADIVQTTGTPAWKFVHTTYAICDLDLLFTEDLQRQALENTTAIDSELLEDCGHCPMISGPEKVLAIVMAIAGEQASLDGTTEEKEFTCQCSNPPVTFGEAFGSADPHPRCVCENRCVCHHNDDCPLKAQYSTMNPDCPCSYGEYYRRVSTATASAPSGGTSTTDPLSSNYSVDFARPSYQDQLDAFDDKLDYQDPYASWDTGLATIGSVETTTRLEDRDIEEITKDESSLRPEMRRSQSATSESTRSESENSAQERHSQPERRARDDGFVPKIMRKTTTLPM